MRDQVSLLMQTQGCALGPCDFRGIKTSWKMCVQARWTRATWDRQRHKHRNTHTHRLTQANTQADTLQKTPAHTHTHKKTRTHTHTDTHTAQTDTYARRHPGIAGRDREHERVRERERERDRTKSKLHELASNQSFYSTKLLVRYHQFMMGKPARYSQELRPSTSTCITLNWTRDCLCDCLAGYSWWVLESLASAWQNLPSQSTRCQFILIWLPAFLHSKFAKLWWNLCHKIVLCICSSVLMILTGWMKSGRGQLRQKQESRSGLDVLLMTPSPLLVYHIFLHWDRLLTVPSWNGVVYCSVSYDWYWLVILVCTWY